MDTCVENDWEYPFNYLKIRNMEYFDILKCKFPSIYSNCNGKPLVGKVVTWSD